MSVNGCTVGSGRGRRRPHATLAARRGLVLVASIGVLGVVSVMGLAFATVMRMEARAARNYTEAVRAEFVARAGIEDAIARLRILARKGFELPYDENAKLPAWADWYTWRGTAGGGSKISYPARARTNAFDDDGDGEIDEADGSEEGSLAYTDWLPNTYSGGDTYTVRVVDAASKINVNVGDNLATMLDNLCRVIGPPLRPARQEHLVPRWYTVANKKYRTPYTDLDKVTTRDLFYTKGADGRPVCFYEDGGVGKGPAIYGDGYAIAGYRAEHGEYLSIEDIRKGLTWNERGDGDNDTDPDGPEADMPEERMEVEAKFAALRPYVTVDSWFDTDQIGYGKFEQILVEGGHATAFTDRNRTWNTKRNPDAAGQNVIDGVTYAGELQGSFLAILSGVGQGQFKTIAGNTIDTIFLSDSKCSGSEMRVPPNQFSSYMIVGRDSVSADMNFDGKVDAAEALQWRHLIKLYARQPLSFHRAPVNVNTASDKVLVATLLGLQTSWGKAGYSRTYVKGVEDLGGWASQTNFTTKDWAHALWQCPSIISLGRDDYNAYVKFDLPCPNDTSFAYANQVQEDHGHENGGPPYCFLCSYGNLWETTCKESKGRYVTEAHYIAWQMLKEREQTRNEDRARGSANANGYGPFRGWDDLFFRVFWPWELAKQQELNVEAQQMVGRQMLLAQQEWKGKKGHPGIARLCMANFNSNTDVLKFQPNLEWLDRWGPNFTDLYIPRPDLISKGAIAEIELQEGRDLRLRVRPGELLDKTDLNIGTTEYSFDSGGVYEVESLGRVHDERGVVAERKFSVLLRIYDGWRESTQREFVTGEIKGEVDPPGTRQAGQIAVDTAEYDTSGTGFKTNQFDGGGRKRKPLCTYPEPVVPSECEVGKSGDPLTYPMQPSRLALKGTAPRVVPAGYDGQIMLAVNMQESIDYYDSGEIGFYHSFTGDTWADIARTDPAPWEYNDLNVYVRDQRIPPIPACSLDMASLLGVLNAEDVDLQPTFQGSMAIEGEGRGGDFRPDGVHLGVVGTKRLDGSFTYLKGNMEQLKGAVTMWIKPMWHHGTLMPASLPITYDPFWTLERGSTVCMRRVWEPDKQANTVNCNPPITQKWWPCALQKYKTQDSVGVDAIGFVRDRFEYEFFNGCVPGGGWGAESDHKFVKAGDKLCSIDDGDWWGDNETHTSPFGALHYQCEVTLDDASFIPGWLHPDSAPFYQIAPFRWQFMGFIWNYDIMNPAVAGARDKPDMSTGTTDNPSYGRGESGTWSHRAYGQPHERKTITEGLKSDGNTTAGNQEGAGFSGLIPVYGHKKDRTAKDNLTLALHKRTFISTMHTWGKLPKLDDDDGLAYHSAFVEGVIAENSSHYDLQDWAFEQYSTMGWVNFPNDNEWERDRTGLQDFGINKVPPVGQHFYQAFWGGAYTTIDEFKIHLTWNGKDPRTNFGWEKGEYQSGRYYFPDSKTTTPGSTQGREPRFRSQTLYDSETTQNFSFGPGEDQEQIELCTVRWTVFTPFYCVDQRSSANMLTGDPWRFPYNSYFSSIDGSNRFDCRFSPRQVKLIKETGGLEGDPRILSEASGTWKSDVMKYGVASRYSSQRGCKVAIEVDEGAFKKFYPWAARPDNPATYAEEQFFEDPEAWSPIIGDYGTGEHVKCLPTQLRYNVWLRLSVEEYSRAKAANAVLLDTPVFDDITVTYMRRPQVLQWRDVTE